MHSGTWTRGAGRAVKRAMILAATLPMFQAASCTPAGLRDVLLAELTQQASLEVFTAVETILLNVFGV